MAQAKHEIAEHITLSRFKLKIDVPAFVKITGKFRESGAKGQDGKPIIVCDIEDLDTPDAGPQEMAANSVFKSEIEKRFPAGAYVGKKFQVIKKAKAEGKAYHTFNIALLK